MDRPPVSVVLPFHGSPEDARETLDALARLRLRPDDEVVVVDNTGRGVVPAGDGVTVVDAPREPSSYYARNEGAAAARHEWLLFLDADCVPSPDLADRYFDEAPLDGWGAVVGEVVGVDGQSSLVARYARSRGHLGQRTHVEHGFRPWGVTANLLVRRAAWESVGGFQEGIRSGGDTEFSWRLQDAGWELGFRPEAVVEHAHRESVRSLARQSARYAAGRRWVMSRYPGALPRPTLVAELARAAAGVVVWTITGQLDRARFKALDAVYVASRWGAFVLSNTPPGRGDRLPPATVAVVCGVFPDREDPAALEAVRALGDDVVVDAVARPVRVERETARRLPIAYAEDDGYARRLGALAWLAVRRPVAVLRAAGAARRGTAPAASTLAPRARRLRMAGVRRVEAAGELQRPVADALARLIGV